MTALQPFYHGEPESKPREEQGLPWERAQRAPQFESLDQDIPERSTLQLLSQ
jgi:hypothetical protein